MPELPEVKAHAERLDRDFAGAVLQRFELLSFTAQKTATPEPATAAGMELLGVTNRGKFLLMSFGSPTAASSPTSNSPATSDSPARADTALTFVVHLMQGGRLVPDDKLARKPRNGLARWRFAEATADGDGRSPESGHEGGRIDGRKIPAADALLLTEAGKEHKAGIWVFEGEPDERTSPLFGLGPDADEASPEHLADALARKNQRLHGFLRDQHGVAGLGRLLANEICHRAKVSPFAMTAALGDNERGAVYAAMQDCVADGLTFERSRDSMSRSADRPAAVHHRKGELCPVCGDTIRAVEYNAYEVDYCPTCQTAGKILADNTTSKFLK